MCVRVCEGILLPVESLEFQFLYEGNIRTHSNQTFEVDKFLFLELLGFAQKISETKNFRHYLFGLVLQNPNEWT